MNEIEHLEKAKTKPLKIEMYDSKKFPIHTCIIFFKYNFNKEALKYAM